MHDTYRYCVSRDADVQHITMIQPAVVDNNAASDPLLYDISVHVSSAFSHIDFP